MIKIYEVLAVERGLPLFLKKHIKRLTLSIGEYKKIDFEKVMSESIKLIKPMLKNCIGFNIKLIYCVENEIFSAEKIKSRRPSEKLYITGASIDLFPGERDHPLIKRENLPFKKITEDFCKKNGLYDVLLINKNGEIPEGSRSNFLLISKKNEIITSPIGDALNGITRDTIFEICKNEKIPVIEKKIKLECIKDASGLIITGTSPELLPIINCGDITFKVDIPIIKNLQNGFRTMKRYDLKATKELFR